MAIDFVSECKDYLSLFEIAENKYLLGVFQKGITFYKQQIRALNIFYALMKTQVLKPVDGNSRMRIGIIGGGVGGVTFAAAALKSGFDVTLYESQKMLLHMQHGCETRKIHPNIYDWPDKDEQSLSPYAKIPVLSWKYDTASRVADQIRNEFEMICEKLKINPVFTECYIERIDTDDIDKNSFSIDCKSQGKPLVHTVDLIIYAPGYGIEKGIKENTTSYWRNEDVAQPLISLEESKTYLISGIGDGGLIDLFRIKISDFDLVELTKVLKADSVKYQKLKSHLLEIKDRWVNEKAKADKNWLYKKLKAIPIFDYQYLIDNYIVPNFVKNKHIIAIGREDEFADNLTLDSISMLNNFLAYILYHKLSAFKYESEKEHEVSTAKFDQRIVRHGTDRFLALRKLKIPEAKIKHLQELQLQRILYENAVHLWRYTDLASYFTHSQNKAIEYFRLETISICSSFISVLSKLLNELPFVDVDHNGPKFRLALHRVIEVDGRPCYQQITSSFKGTDFDKKRNIGMFNDTKIGSIGLTVRTGKALLVKKKTGKDLEDLKGVLGHNSDFDIQNSNSFLTIPVLGKTDGDKLATNLVLFVDSESDNMFEVDAIVKTIYIHLIGFVSALNNLLKNNQIYMVETDFSPQEVDSNNLQGLKNSLIIDLSEKYPFLDPLKSELLFDVFHSFDIVYNHPSQFRYLK